jgi:hypothetical protein
MQPLTYRLDSTFVCAPIVSSCVITYLPHNSVENVYVLLGYSSRNGNTLSGPILKLLATNELDEELEDNDSHLNALDSFTTAANIGAAYSTTPSKIAGALDANVSSFRTTNGPTGNISEQVSTVIHSYSTRTDEVSCYS